MLQPRQRLCAIFSVSQQRIPANNAIGGIPDRNAADLKPTKFAVEAPHACFGPIGNAGRDRFCKDFSEMGKIIGMYRSVCTPVSHLFQRLAAIFKDLTIYS